MKYYFVFNFFRETTQLIPSEWRSKWINHFETWIKLIGKTAKEKKSSQIYLKTFEFPSTFGNSDDAEKLNKDFLMHTLLPFLWSNEMNPNDLRHRLIFQRHQLAVARGGNALRRLCHNTGSSLKKALLFPQLKHDIFSKHTKGLWCLNPTEQWVKKQKHFSAWSQTK